VGNLGANVVTFTDATVAYSTGYNYRVFATGSAGDSAASNTATVTTPSGVPATPTGFGTTQQGTAVRVSWTDVATNETGYVVERRTGAGGYAVLATLAAGTTSYTDSAVASSTTYTYRVKATGTVGDSTYSTESTITTPAPSSYVSTVIGSPMPAGSTTVVSNGVDYNVSAGGTDIWNSSDSFRFVSRSVTGDFDMAVRVNALTYVNDFTQAGLMARDGTAANARNFMVKYRARADARVTYRTTTGGATVGAGTGAVKVPNAWLRLQRTGNTFVGYASSNGTSWTEVARVTMSLPTTLQIGVAVCSRQQGTATSAQFRSLSVTQPTVGASVSGSAVPGTLVVPGPDRDPISGDVLK
jgi:regulation of enolase protein 1 (concanavalin A-like superfamily)